MTYHIIRLDWQDREKMSMELNQRIRDLTVDKPYPYDRGHRVIAMTENNDELNVLVGVED